LSHVTRRISHVTGHRILIFKACRNAELDEELQDFYNMPPTTNVVESNNRNTYRFMSYKQMPIVIAAWDVFKFCRHELRQLTGIQLGHVSVRGRENDRQKRLMSVTDEYNKGQRVPVSTSEHLGGGAAKPKGAVSGKPPQPPRLGVGSAFKAPITPDTAASAPKKQRRFSLVIHSDADRIHRVNALIEAGEATAGYFVELFSGEQQSRAAEDRWFMQVVDSAVSDGNLRARYCITNSLNRDSRQEETDCPLAWVKDYGDRGLFVNL
jgi:hypothetical protein